MRRSLRIINDLTKFRLSLFSVATTIVAYLLACQESQTCPNNRLLLIHVFIGSSLCAWSAAILNQILEKSRDQKMSRTSQRPLPKKLIADQHAFIIAWLLAGFGVAHLIAKCNLLSALCAIATIAVYIFIYTPMKIKSTWNTFWGAIAGALPTLIGFAAAMPKSWENVELVAKLNNTPALLELITAWTHWLASPQAFTVFLLVFLWQFPHFFAIAWLHRHEYQKAGFVMLGAKDESGEKISKLLALCLLACLAFGFIPLALHFITNCKNFNPALLPQKLSHFAIAHSILLLPIATKTSALVKLCRQKKSKQNAKKNLVKKIFLLYLLYLPIACVLLLIF